MSKGLKAFARFCDSVNACINSGGITNIDSEAEKQVEKELKDKTKFEELVNMDLDLFMKAVDIKGLIEEYQEIKKVLEIIKKKKVNVSALLELDNLQQYNAYCNLAGNCKKLTIEEYELLTEVLL